MSAKYSTREEERAALEKAIVSDSLFALGATFVGASVLSAIAYRFSPTYRRIPISAKTALILGPALGAFYIRGEHVGTEFRRSKYLHQLEGGERDEALARQRAAEARQSLASRSADFVTENRWSILGATWLTGISGSMFYLYRQKGMSGSQKLVQARMYAQLITIVGILSTAAIASLSGKTKDAHAQKNSAELDAILAGETKIEEDAAASAAGTSK
ncbi:Replication factor C, subunit RFC4 [Coemansia javaensis]|uniref:Replication factor C, subunit RFC4 n=1 Tax=Coemansia javaensis TaxID=2761396 RepID=A0A9W8HND2_9FUNG|nr:Replication factor C, subunit RFC4 [Coemansia javaensis]